MMPVLPVLHVQPVLLPVLPLTMPLLPVLHVQPVLLPMQPVLLPVLPVLSDVVLFVLPGSKTR